MQVSYSWQFWKWILNDDHLTVTKADANSKYLVDTVTTVYKILKILFPVFIHNIKRRGINFEGALGEFSESKNFLSPTLSHSQHWSEQFNFGGNFVNWEKWSFLVEDKNRQTCDKHRKAS